MPSSHSVPVVFSCDSDIANYTHRIAISNSRIVSFDGEHVCFRYRDYAHGNAEKLLTLDVDEFLRRFLLHVPPPRLRSAAGRSKSTRIRYYGFLANRTRAQSIDLARNADCRRSTRPLRLLRSVVTASIATGGFRIELLKLGRRITVHAGARFHEAPSRGRLTAEPNPHRSLSCRCHLRQAVAPRLEVHPLRGAPCCIWLTYGENPTSAEVNLGVWDQVICLSVSDSFLAISYRE
jgi:hypothetical protein